MRTRSVEASAGSGYVASRAVAPAVSSGDGLLVGMAIAYLVLGLLVAPVVVIVSSLTAYDSLIMVVIAMMSVLVAFEWRRVGHPVTPAGIAALGGLLIFGLRPITVASSGATTPGAMADTRLFVAGTIDAGVVSLAQVILFFTVFGFAYFLLQARPPRPPRLTPVLRPGTVRRAGILLALVTLFGLGCAFLLVQSSGGFAAHFSGVSVRSSFLAGRYYLTLAYIPMTVALVLYVLCRRHSGMRDWNGGAFLAAAALCAVGFTTGGRGPLLLGVVIPILILKQSGPTRLSSGRLGLIGVALLAGAMVMSLFLREGNYDEGASIRALQADPVGTLLTRLTSGAETRPFDSLILLNEQDALGNVPVLLGSTYAAVPTWFLPGEIAPWKDGGANTWFTKTYIPRFYYPDQIETSISAIGEAFANYRYVGIFVVAALVAMAAVAVGLRRESNGLSRTLFAALLTPMFFSFVRGDAFQNLSTVVLMLMCVGLFGLALGLIYEDETAAARSSRRQQARVRPSGSARRRPALQGG